MEETWNPVFFKTIVYSVNIFSIFYTMSWILLCYSFFQIGADFNFSASSVWWESELEGEAVCFVGLVPQSNSTGKSFCLAYLRKYGTLHLNQLKVASLLNCSLRKMFLPCPFNTQNKIKLLGEESPWKDQLLLKLSSYHQTRRFATVFTKANYRKQL